MFQKAYLQLMDVKPMKVVNKYLSIQKDWTNDKKMSDSFFDFLNSPKSDLFSFFQIYWSRFDEIVGIGKVWRTIEMVIYQEMTMAIPRPGYREACDLSNLVDAATAEERASVCYINWVIEEQNYREILSFGKKYLESINQYDSASSIKKSKR